MSKTQRVFNLILILTFFAVVVAFPKNVRIKFNIGKIKVYQTFSSPDVNFTFLGQNFKRDLEIKKGLDLAGGSQLVFEADMKGIAQNARQDALNATRDNIERRVNLFGVAEPNIQTSRLQDKFRVIVELSGITNTEDAISLIGKTAVLNFRLEEASPSAATNDPQFGPYKILTKLTGKNLKKASVVFDQNTGSPQVSLEFDKEGTQFFANITKNNVGKSLAIFLDDQIVSAPRINQAILGGNAVISGNFTLDDAKRLSTQLNAGALPVPIKLVSQNTISPTLGVDSINKSVRGGLIGLSCVTIFMIVIYGRLGFLADLSLLVYGVLSLAIYKLIPITLTLPGIAGFILSVGMAVDSNILIFERYKEELKKRQNPVSAMEMAFGRAWDSIRDANFTTLLVCFILFNPLNWSFLNISGMIRGFALTLALGVLISLFTGLVVTRTFIRMFYKK